MMKVLGVVVSIGLGGLIGLLTGAVGGMFFGKVGAIVGFVFPMIWVGATIMNGYAEGQAKAQYLNSKEDK